MNNLTIGLATGILLVVVWTLLDAVFSVTMGSTVSSGMLMGFLFAIWLEINQLRKERKDD